MMTTLPTELWLIIFDLVIQEGIVQVDDCDHTKFPYIRSILSTARLSYHFHDSYYRLRLVCRSFRAILGDPPSQILLPSSTFPLSTTIRAAIIDLNAWPRANVQLLSAEVSSCRRLVYLDVTCDLVTSSNRPNLSDFLLACAGEAFHDIRRLTLRMWNRQAAWFEKSFWVRLHDAFPWLVTLVITQDNPHDAYLWLEKAERVVSFEWLEILYLDDKIWYAGCRFSRLRHASIWDLPYDGPNIVTSSPHLESILIRSPHNNPMDLSPCSRLRLLGVHGENCYNVSSMGSDYPLEHLWIIVHNHVVPYNSLRASLTRLRRVLRITVEFSSPINEKGRARITRELQEIDFASFGMNMIPPVDGDSLLVFERSLESIDL